MKACVKKDTFSFGIPGLGWNHFRPLINLRFETEICRAGRESERPSLVSSLGEGAFLRHATPQWKIPGSEMKSLIADQGIIVRPNR